MFDNLSYYLPVFGVIALLFVFYKNSWVSKQDPGNEKMQFIASNISKGAMAFLKAEYKILAIFVIVVGILLGFKGYSEGGIPNALIAVSFLVGALCSGLAGFIGMVVATKANVRTTNAARTSLGKGLEVAFAGGSVMGLGVVGLGVLGLSSLFLLYDSCFQNTDQVITVLGGFSLGASSIALFASCLTKGTR